MVIRGVLWDLDGVIVDTYDWHLQAMLNTMDYYGFTVDPENLGRLFGTSTEKIIQAVLKERATPEMTAMLKQKHSDLFCEAVVGKVVPFPGAVELVGFFKQRGLKQAIASSSTKAIIETLLGEVGVLGEFDRIVSGADLPPKPSPAVFLEAAKALELPTDHCLVIEDSPMGIRGAKSGGIRCLAVTTSRDTEALSEADVIVSGLNQVDGKVLETLEKLN